MAEIDSSDAYSGRRTRTHARRLVVALVALLAMVGVGLAVWSPAASPSTRYAMLEHRGSLVWVGGSPPRAIAGTRIERLDPSSPLGRAFGSADPSVAVRALRASRQRVVVLETAATRGFPPSSMPAVLGRFGIVEGMRTTAVRSGLVVAEPLELPALEPAEKFALARAGRQILAGSTPPRLSQFPPRLRAPIPVEVMLSLRRANGELALWRSARASSIASGLLTTARVAMERWGAREGNLGSSLEDALPELDVEVSLLVDDGTILTRAPAFIDRAVTREHGVAYDLPSSWHYLLPEAPERTSAAKASDAFRALFRDNQLREDAFDRADLRLYRVRVLPLGVSPRAR